MIIIGDIHGNINGLIDKIKHHDMHNKNLIQLGDAGIGFSHVSDYMDRWSDFNDFLEKRNIIMYIVRGNHDNPRYFGGKDDYTNIRFVPDYSVLNIENKNILFLGGALSIDRSVRLTGKSYWKNEGFVFDPTKVENLKNIDLVVSHSCPNFAQPVNFNSIVDYWHDFEKGMDKNKNLKEELKKERLLMASIYTILKSNKNPITHWFYSHFHTSGRQIYEEIDFVLLDIDEWYDFKS